MKKILSGNWKMNLRISEAEALTSEIVNIYQTEIPFDEAGPEMVLCPPNLYLFSIQHLTKSVKGISVGAQNVSERPFGAFTGEVNSEMLVAAGCRYVIIGHSERRQYFHESDELTALKILAAQKTGLIPILCVGENQSERTENRTLEVITRQLSALPPEGNSPLVIAYEPVWAIGTGLTATPAQAQAVHAFIRSKIHNFYGSERAVEIPILYGGSLNAQNAESLFAEPDVNGGLVGGASLKSREWIEIFKKLKKS